MQEKKKNTEYLDFIETKFNDFFENKNYIKEVAVDITSQIDPTIDFIGSKISPLKKYIINDSIPDNGLYLIQNSMKLKSMKFLKSEELQKFGCYYKCMGTLTKPDLNKIVSDLFEFLTSSEYLNISMDDIMIRVCSMDKDLIKSIKSVDLKIKYEVDTVSLKHYRHKYGMDEINITGRDFNIGIRKKSTNEFFNCGTLVLMEKDNNPIGIDMGLGNCSFAMCKFGYGSTIQSSRMADIVQIDSIAKEKFADSLIAISILLKENVYIHQSKHFRKKFRQFLNCLMYWNQQFNYTEEQLIDYILEFLNAEYNINFEDKHNEWVKILKK